MSKMGEMPEIKLNNNNNCDVLKDMTYSSDESSTPRGILRRRRHLFPHDNK